MSEGKADGPRDWAANVDRDIKARSGERESINVYPSAISTRNGTGAFEHTENSMRARLYGKRLIDHSDTDIHTGCYAAKWQALFPGKSASSVG